MTDIESTVEAIADADWNSRVALIRKVPEQFGTAQHQRVYSAIAERVYVPNLAPDFAYVHWRDRYELPTLQEAYGRTFELTDGFKKVDLASLKRVVLAEPRAVRVFRLLLGLLPQEFAAASGLAASLIGSKPLTKSRIEALEKGRSCSEEEARCCATLVDQVMKGTLFPPPPSDDVKPKLEKPDTLHGWSTVRKYAANGVPFAVFLHQRDYGGAFRQLLDSTSTRRGNLLEDAFEKQLKEQRVPYIRTGARNQEEIRRRFGLTVKPAPDFVVFDIRGNLRCFLESKGANDGGTARDKSARFGSLKGEATRLGGVPLFALLAGLGWRRTADALGPVVRDTDGRVFTLASLTEILTVLPFPDLIGTLPA